MSQFSYKPYYERRLPHIQLPGATLFITFRLAGSIPCEVVQRLCTEAERIDAKLRSISDPRERAEHAYQEQRRMFGK